jgi:hypothetical protein
MSKPYTFREIRGAILRVLLVPFAFALTSGIVQRSGLWDPVRNPVLARAIADCTHDVKMVFVGPSLILRHVDAQQVSDETGEHAALLSSLGQRQGESLMAIKEVLKNRPPERPITFIISPGHKFDPTRGKSKNYFTSQLSWPELWWTFKQDPQIVLSDLFLGLFHVTPSADPCRFSPRHAEDATRESREYHLNDPESTLENYRAFGLPSRSPQRLSRIQAFVRELEKLVQGTPHQVIWLDPPQWSFHALLAETTAGEAECWSMPFNPLLDQPDMWWDKSHLVAAGAQIYTDWIIGKVQSHVR